MLVQISRTAFPLLITAMESQSHLRLLIIKIISVLNTKKTTHILKALIKSQVLILANVNLLKKPKFPIQWVPPSLSGTSLTW